MTRLLLAGAGCLLVACTAAPSSERGYVEVKCQLGRQEAYTSEHQCETMGGTVLRRTGPSR